MATSSDGMTLPKGEGKSIMGEIFGGKSGMKLAKRIEEGKEKKRPQEPHARTK
jgi:hypothetical protein